MKIRRDFIQGRTQSLLPTSLLYATFICSKNTLLIYNTQNITHINPHLLHIDGNLAHPSPYIFICNIITHISHMSHLSMTKPHVYLPPYTKNLSHTPHTENTCQSSYKTHSPTYHMPYIHSHYPPHISHTSYPLLLYSPQFTHITPHTFSAHATNHTYHPTSSTYKIFSHISQQTSVRPQIHTSHTLMNYTGHIADI